MAQANVKAIITAEDRASKVVQNFGGSFTRLAGSFAVGQLAADGFRRAVQGLSGAVKFAVSSAADFEQNRIAFETMLGSAQAAKKMLKEVSDFAIKTPFELPEVVTGAKQLLAYSIEAEKILPTFKALGNIAAGVGRDKLPQLILAFGQVKAATKLTGMELRQFTEAGVPLLEILAKQSGKTAAQIKEDMEGGAAPSFEEVERAIFGMSKEGGKFFNLMDRQSRTFSGTVSNLRDNIGRFARELIGITEEGDIKEGSIFARLSDAAQKLLKWMDDNKAMIMATAQRWIDKIIEFGTVVVETIPKIAKIWDDHKFLILGVTGAIVSLTLAYKTLQTVILVTTAIEAASKAIAILGATSVGSAISVGGLATAIAGLIATAALPIIFVVALAGFAIVMDQIRQLRGEAEKASEAAGNAATAFQKFVKSDAFKAMSKEDQQRALRNLQPRAMGGPVQEDKPFLVGERGPELFIPNSSGKIVPNNQMGGSPINITIQAGAFTGSRADGRRFAEMIIEDLKSLANKKNQSVSQMLGI